MQARVAGVSIDRTDDESVQLFLFFYYSYSYPQLYRKEYQQNLVDKYNDNLHPVLFDMLHHFRMDLVSSYLYLASLKHELDPAISISINYSMPYPCVIRKEYQ